MESTLGKGSVKDDEEMALALRTNEKRGGVEYFMLYASSKLNIFEKNPTERIEMKILDEFS